MGIERVVVRGSCSGRQLQRVAVAVKRLRCGEVAVWGCCCGGKQGVGDFKHGGAVLWEMEKL